MILEDSADVAAVDCVTYALLERHRPAALAGTRILCTTGAVPAPPYVTGIDSPEPTVRILREAFGEALKDPELESVRQTLMLEGIEHLTLDAYQPIADLENMVTDLGYSEIPSHTPPRANP